MSIKHHQANVSETLRDAGGAIVQKHNATVSVYDTNQSFPSTGADYYVFNSDLGGASGPSFASPADVNKVSSGKIGNLFVDWAGGGPEASTSSTWQTIMQGIVWGLDGGAAPVDVTFKLIYSGGAILSVSSTWSGYESTPAGNLGTVLIDDWDQNGESSDQTKVVTTPITGAGFVTSGAFAFRLRYWNRTDNPYLVCFMKRDGIDDDFVVMGASTLTSDFIPKNGDTYATTKTVLEDVVSWTVDRAHDNVTTADVLVFIDNTNSENAYDPATESFGDIKKGNYIEIEAGYGGTETKRFVGNISGGTQISREDNGAYVTLHCESIEGFLIDSKNFNYPNNVMYAYAEYSTDASPYYEPDGVDRPVAFDQWSLTTAIRAVALNAGVDDYYLNQYREFYNENGTINTSTTKLIRDLNINLSRTPILPSNNVNLPEQEYLWVYDFGQDTAYDIVKDILKKYGYYLGSVGGGSSCGAFELIEVESPTDIVTSINSGLSTGYTLGNPTEYAEGFITTKMNAGSSTLVVNWTGTGANLLMGVGPSLSDSLIINFKVDAGDADWTALSGYFNDFDEYSSAIISTEYTDSDYNVFSYENLNAASGGNPSVFSLIFNKDSGGNPIPLPYGDHLLRIIKSTTEVAYFEAILGYDYGGEAYKKYSTYSVISALDVENSVADIRNDIVVLGAPKGSFAFVADEDTIPNVQEKYVTARAVDPRSIHDPTYKFYVGRRKQFIIEDPTIITQERAEWLSVHTLEKYRVTASSGTIMLPCDLGLQLYDKINIEETKTGSVDPDAAFNINQLTETYSNEEYSIRASYLTHWIPPSFRKRSEISVSDIHSYFNGSPIAFEKMLVPILDGKTGYDPMSAEDGHYIDFEWTLLVPGITSLELFDTRSEGRVPHIHANESANELVAVPFIGQYEFPGKYRARWDGVYEGYDLNSKFTGTKYEIIYRMPYGNGFGARGQSNKLIDLVNPAAINDDDVRAKKIVQFPLYPLMKFEALYPEHIGLEQVINFGSVSGTGIRDGVPISAGDNEAFDVGHFDLEERQKLYWNFNHETFGTPSDQDNFMVYTEHATELSEDLSQVFIREPSRNEAFQIRNDITHRIMACDPKRPFAEYNSTGAEGRQRPNVMPMIDIDMGVRLFIDGDYIKDRRYYIHAANIHINVLTHVTEEITYTCHYYQMRHDQGSHTYDPVYFDPHAVVSRIYNYSFVQDLGGIPFTEFTLATQKLKYQTWTFLPKIADSTTDDSLIFNTRLHDEGKILDKVENGKTINWDSAVSGIGVGKVFATEIDELVKTRLTHYQFLRNTNPYSIPARFAPPQTGAIARTPSQYFIRDGEITDTYANPQYWARTLATSRGNNQTIVAYDGACIFDKRIYNSIVVSIDMILIDRLGRCYFSAAKTDEGSVKIGRFNDVEFHSQIGREMCQYVNRWDPYLPTACYFEREPATLTLDGIGGNALSVFHQGTYTTYNPDFNSTNLTLKIINNVDTSGSVSLDFPVTTPYPVRPVNKHLTGLAGIYYRSFDVNRLGLYNLSQPEYSDGARFAFFGSHDGIHNSYVWNADPDSDHPSRRDHTSESPVGPWGLPLYISGGFTNKTLAVQGSSPSYHVVSELTDFGMPYFNGNGDKWLWYIRAFPNLDPPSAVGFKNNKNGLFSFFKHMPVFTLVGGGKYRHTFTI